MAAVSVSTPIGKPRGVFNTQLAGGRIPLTPSPRSSPYTPPRSISDRQASQPFATNVPHLRSVSRTHRDSPKSNIAKTKNSPKQLELGLSNWTLTGTGPALAQTPIRKSKTGLRSRTKNTIRIEAGDRYIPNRLASEGLHTIGLGKPDHDAKPKGSGLGSAILANAALDLGATSVEDDVIAALDNLDIQEEENSRKKNTDSAYESSLASACGMSLNQRILAFKPAPPESSKPIDLRTQYNRPLKPANTAGAQFRRRVLTAPERVLDAPGLVDDYYLNLLDWSSGNQVAIGLERNVYVWSAESGSVNCLLETTPDTYISSVKWSGDGAYVSVGLGTGEIQIWDVEEGTKLRSMHGHDSRVGVMGWNKHVLSTGARSGLVFNHDVRVAQHKIAELVSHTAEVCGLEWRADGSQLATGGNDNLVTIWDSRSLNAPKFQKTNHKAAVKALSWCPWQNNLLATGGGSYDRNIHFWNTTTGARVNSIDTGSQVTSLRWSPHYREIVSSSGFPDNSLSIWSYPTLVRNIEIPAHETRVLHSCLSPDGQMLATAGKFLVSLMIMLVLIWVLAADESLKFWKLFEKKPGAPSLSSRESTLSGKGTEMAKQMTIR